MSGFCHFGLVKSCCWLCALLSMWYIVCAECGVWIPTLLSSSVSVECWGLNTYSPCFVSCCERSGWVVVLHVWAAHVSRLSSSSPACQPESAPESTPALKLPESCVKPWDYSTKTLVLILKAGQPPLGLTIMFPFLTLVPVLLETEQPSLSVLLAPPLLSALPALPWPSARTPDMPEPRWSIPPAPPWHSARTPDLPDPTRLKLLVPHWSSAWALDLPETSWAVLQSLSL